MKQSAGNSRGRAVRQRVCVLVVALGIAAALWFLQSPDHAQSELRSAQPSVSAHLERAPEHVRLGFAEAPAPDARARIMVLSPEDEDLAVGPASTDIAGVSQPVAALEERGAYQVSYEVPMADGSVSRGQYWFWYSPASRTPPWLAVPVLPGIALAVLAAVLMAIGRRRKALAQVPARMTAVPLDVTASPVPAQRTPRNHEGVSPPGNRPRPSPVTEPQDTDRPRQG